MVPIYMAWRGDTICFVFLFFIFGSFSFVRICPGLCIHVFFSHISYHHGVWSALRFVRTYGILTIIRRTRGHPLLLGWMR